MEKHTQAFETLKRYKNMGGELGMMNYFIEINRINFHFSQTGELLLSEEEIREVYRWNKEQKRSAFMSVIKEFDSMLKSAGIKLDTSHTSGDTSGTTI